MIEQAMEVLSGATCIQFVNRDPDADVDYVSIQHGPSGCYSSIGRRGKGKQILNLAKGCFSQIYTIAHEFMHALGFWHMQSAPTRDTYVKINLKNVEKGKENNFEKQKTALMFNTIYDYGSVMHYANNAFAKSAGLVTIEAKVSEIIELLQRRLWIELKF